ncbi:MAG: hypothetical protein QOJ51_485 [Acidobacteriaceae bacterium]|jgi:hypothetical protein|nr:hypothetical protein [Acidobacteriaceae bacterium]
MRGYRLVFHADPKRTRQDQFRRFEGLDNHINPHFVRQKPERVNGMPDARRSARQRSWHD